MGKRILGIVLSIVGIIVLILAAFAFMNGGEEARNIKRITINSLVAAVLFFVGIGLLPNSMTTKEKITQPSGK